MLLPACADRAPHRTTPLDLAFHAADSLRLDGRSAEAIPILVHLRDSLATAGDTAGVWRADLWLADARIGVRDMDSARAELTAALVLAGADPDREGWVRNEHALLLDRLGKFDSAAAEALRARALARIAHDSMLEAKTFNETGRIHSLTGHYREAIDDNSQSLAIELALGAEASRGMAIELNELGIGYRHLGRFTDAEQVLSQALTLERAHGNPEGIARASFNLANVYVATGDDARALPLMLDALRTVEPTGNVRGEIFVRTDLAELYTRAARYPEARTHILKALALNHGTFAYSRVELLGALARLDLAEGRPAIAIVLLDSAVRAADSAGYGRQRASARASLARAQIALGDPRRAVASGAAAVRMADSLDDPEAQVEARESYAAALEAAGRSSALDEYRATIALLESWRGRIALGDLRMGVAQPRLGAYEGAIRLLVQNGRAGEAFDVAEHARARLLLDLMRDRGDGPSRSRREQLRRRIRERGDARDDVGPRERAMIDREIAALTDSLGAGLASDPAPLPIGAIQRRLLAPGRSMFAIFWGERDVYGWWITATSVRATRLGRADSLASTIEFLRGAIEDTTGRVPWRPAARRLFAAVVAPLAPDASEELLVIADGPLSNVPVEVFLPSGDTLPWGATRRIGYGPSASVLATLMPSAGQTRWDRAFLGIGDPAPAPRRAGEMRAGERDDARVSLPYAAVEAHEIAALFANGTTDVLTGREATLTRWRALDPSRYRYLHFAAHSSLAGRRSGASAVMLADSALDLPAIRALDLTAELVTLSACETALGDRVRGEGVLGLSHAFLSAGARGTVVTLWPIRDRSAADFMTAFYRELSAGAAPSAALLTVRRAWISSGGVRAQPARWAPYVLIGAVRPRDN